MAITGATDLGDGLLCLTIDHDPESTSTDAPAGSLFIDSSGVFWHKDTDGDNTDVSRVTATSLAQLNALISDATLDDSGDPRDPNAHAATHTNGTDDIADFVGDSGAGGTKGLVPAPAAGDAAAGKTLNADGTWSVPAAPGVVETTVATTDNTLTTIDTVSLADDLVYLIEAEVVGRRTDAADRAGYIRRAVAYREGGGGAVIQGNVQTGLTRESDNGWNCVMNVSGNDVLIQVEGDAATSVNWKCSRKTISVG